MPGGLEIDADRVIADLRELARRTGNERGAQRECWTQTWRDAREFQRELLAEFGAETELDEAGNLWARLPGAASGPALVVGSHVDSVPDGGWLDGALGAMAAIGVMRAHAESPAGRPIVFVDWADEEGSRFGRSLFGSSAFAGDLDPTQVRYLTDRDGVTLERALAENGLEIDRALESQKRQAELSGYLELHIEQGPVLEAEGVTAAAVRGCQGTERLRFEFTGQAGHAGTTPMSMRRDAGLAAAAAALAIARIPDDTGGVATTGELQLEPGISTALAGVARLSCDLRNPDADALATMLESARLTAASAAADQSCELTETHIWSIEPIPFDEHLVAVAGEACRAVAGSDKVITSGALHDAAEVARVLPAAMIFCPSRGGISHALEEDTSEADLRVAIQAFAEAVRRVVSG